MRIQQFLLLFVLICITFSVQAQKEETLLGSHGLRLSGAWGGNHNMISDFNESNGLLSGGFGGLEFGKTLLVGFSNYQLVNDVEFDQLSSQSFDLNYNGLLLGAAIKSYKPIHGTVNFLVAGGKVKYKDDISDKIVVFQPSAGIEINVFRWFHLGLDAGYRFATDTNPTLMKLNDSDLSGGFAQLSLKFGYSWGRRVGWGKKKKSKTDIRIDIED